MIMKVCVLCNSVRRIHLINVNDAPVLNIDVGDESKSYSEGDPALLVASSIKISDSDNEQLVEYAWCPGAVRC